MNKRPMTEANSVWEWASDTTRDLLIDACNSSRADANSVDGSLLVARMTVLAAEIIHGTEKFCAVLGQEEMANSVMDLTFRHLEECRMHPGMPVEELREKLDCLLEEGSPDNG